jgi:hypothetical protein
MKIVSKARDRFIVSTDYASTDRSMLFAVEHLTTASSSEGFPFKNFEVILVCSWYESKHKTFYYTFRFRWRDAT